MPDRTIEKQIDALVGALALADPIIVYDQSWGETLPGWLKGEIKTQRLIQLMKGEEGIATDAEALAYVSNASLVAPMQSEWADIYMYLFTKVMGDKAPDDLRKESLDDYKMGELEHLKRWIYRQRVKAREERLKAEKRVARAEAEAKRPEQLRLGM